MSGPAPLIDIHQLLRTRGAPKRAPAKAAPPVAGGGPPVVRIGAPAPIDFKAAVPLVPVDRREVDDRAQRLTGREYQQISAATAELEDRMTPLAITGTRIYVMSYEEQQKLAVYTVNVPQMTGIGSPNDKRGGVLEDYELCGTCNQTNMDCTGHFGIINLRRSYINPMFAKAAIWLLQCVCNSCGRLLIDRMQMERAGLFAYRGLNRIKRAAELCEKMPCRHRLSGAQEEKEVEPLPGCPEQKVAERQPCVMNPIYNPGKMKDTYKVMQEYNDKANGKIVAELPISRIESIFCSIPRKDLRLLDFDDNSHPRDWIMKALLVTPPCARPYTYRDGEHDPDHLSSAYVEVVKYNTMMPHRGKVDDLEKQRQEIERNLYFFISHLMDNTDGKYTFRRDELLLSVKDRLTTKNGYIRGLTMGKRNNFIARTVLGPFKGRFGQVGQPERTRRVLTKPEAVTIYNRERILQLYRDGKVTHLTPGSGKLKGRRIRIMDTTRAHYTPQLGDTVDRWGQDGDEVIFNRQPTLHKQAFMGYESKYEPEETIKLHESNTTPHNADFDGDEGNIHDIQTLDARAEVRYVANVKDCVMNAQANRPMMGMVYNSISSAYMMTYKDVELDDDEWEEAIATLDDRTSLDAHPQLASGDQTVRDGPREGWASLSDRLRRHQVPERSGRALFSILLPPDFYYTNGDVKIRDGILVAGVLTKKHIGPSAGGIIHHLWKMYSKDRVARFFTECKFLLDWFILNQGLSIGYKHCHAANANDIRDIIRKEIVQTQLRIDSLGAITPDMTPLELEFREKQTQNFLNNVERIGKDIGLKALAPNNPLNIMSNSGAKGSATNTAQITGILGQQFIKGARPKRVMTNGTRCLPYFEPNSEDIEANGFIFENFRDGIGAAGLFFHLSASRIGLIDTAVRTADSGFLHHRLSKVLEDVSISQDGSVRNANNVIFQYCFADGFNAGELIPTHSAMGNLVSFIDLKAIVGKLNLSLGYNYT